MSSDDLDARIRAMVRDAVDAAPDAPELPLDASGGDVVRTLAPRGPRWVWAGIGIAAAVAAVAVLVMTSRDNDRTVAVDPTNPASTISPDSTGVADPVPWPNGFAIIVASERGIERVESDADGQARITRVLGGVVVDRAFELEDGTIVYQERGGDIWAIDAQGEKIGDIPLVTSGGALSLEDADAPNGNLRLVYRDASSDPASAGLVTAWFQPGSPTSAQMPGGFGVGYHRFSIVNDTTVIAATMDDTGQRSAFTFSFGDGEQLAPGFEQPLLTVGDGQGNYVALSPTGAIQISGASRDGTLGDVSEPADAVDMDMRGDILVVQNRSKAGEVFDVSAQWSGPVPVDSGNLSVSRASHQGSGPTPTTIPPPPTDLTPTTGPVPTTTPTTVPGSVNEGQPYPSCLTVTSDRIADVQLGSMFYSFDPPIPEEPITVSGRPAVLTTYGTGYGVVFRQPDWCTEYGMTTNSMSKAEFLDWLSTVVVKETLPPSMPPVLLRSTYGVSVVTAEGTTPVYRGPVDQALLLSDGRVVFHAIDLADFQMWDPATGATEPIWAAADWVAQPVLHDTYRDSFIFSVGKVMYWYDHDQTWTLGASSRRASITTNGGLVVPDLEPGATSPNGTYSAFSRSGVVEVDSGNGVEYQSTNSDVEVTDLDLHDAGWLTISEIPPGDSPLRVRMVELSTGRFIQFDGAESAHLG